MEEQPDFHTGISVKGCIAQNKPIISNLISVSLGIAVGIALKLYVPLSREELFIIGLPADVLIQMIQMITLPLLVTGVMKGVYVLHADTLRKIAVRAAVYFVSTTVISMTVGVILVLLIEPGADPDGDDSETEDDKTFVTLDAVLDIMRNMVPPNLIEACFQQYKTERLEIEMHHDDTDSGHGTNSTTVKLVGQNVDGADVLGLIFVTLVFAVTIKGMKERGKVLLDVLLIFYETTKYVVNMILCYLPVGLMFMTASYIAELRDWEELYRVIKFLAVVVIGLLIHGLIVLPAIYQICVRRSPWSIIRGVSPALLTAALIPFRSAHLPQTHDYCLTRNDIDPRISRFMLSMGSNVNVDGSALYTVVAVAFVAQLNQIYLDFSLILNIAVTAAVASCGAPVYKTTGVMGAIFVLSALNLPVKAASILVVAECLLERCISAINVLGDCLGAAIVSHLSLLDLAEMDLEDPNRMSNQEVELRVQAEEVHSNTPGALEITQL